MTEVVTLSAIYPQEVLFKVCWYSDDVRGRWSSIGNIDVVIVLERKMFHTHFYLYLFASTATSSQRCAYYNDSFKLSLCIYVIF